MLGRGSTLLASAGLGSSDALAELRRDLGMAQRSWRRFSTSPTERTADPTPPRNAVVTARRSRNSASTWTRCRQRRQPSESAFGRSAWSWPATRFMGRRQRLRLRGAPAPLKPAPLKIAAAADPDPCARQAAPGHGVGGSPGARRAGGVCGCRPAARAILICSAAPCAWTTKPGRSPSACCARPRCCTPAISGSTTISPSCAPPRRPPTSTIRPASIPALAVRPNNTWLHLRLGMVLSNKRAYPQAIAEFTRVLDRNPDYLLALRPRAVAYLQIGRIDEGIADLTRGNRGREGQDLHDLRYAATPTRWRKITCAGRLCPHPPQLPAKGRCLACSRRGVS